MASYLEEHFFDIREEVKIGMIEVYLHFRISVPHAGRARAAERVKLWLATV